MGFRNSCWSLSPLGLATAFELGLEPWGARPYRAARKRTRQDRSSLPGDAEQGRVTDACCAQHRVEHIPCMECTGTHIQYIYIYISYGLRPLPPAPDLCILGLQILGIVASGSWNFWDANLSFGMIGGFTLASWGTLGRFWDTGEHNKGHSGVQAWISIDFW